MSINLKKYRERSPCPSSTKISGIFPKGSSQLKSAISIEPLASFQKNRSTTQQSATATSRPSNQPEPEPTTVDSAIWDSSAFEGVEWAFRPRQKASGSHRRPRSVGPIVERGRTASRFSDLSLSFIPVNRVRPHSTGDLPAQIADESSCELSFISPDLDGIARRAISTSKKWEDGEIVITASNNNEHINSNQTDIGNGQASRRVPTGMPGVKEHRARKIVSEISDLSGSRTRNSSISSAASSSTRLSKYTLDMDILDKDNDGGRDQFYEDSRLAKNATARQLGRSAPSSDAGPEDFTLNIVDYLDRSSSDSRNQATESSEGAGKVAAITSQLEALNKKLQITLSELQESREKETRANNNLLQAEQELNETNEDLLECQKDLHEANTELKDTKDELMEAGQKLQGTLDLAAQNQADLKHLKIELETTREELKETTEELDGTKEDLEETEIEMENLRLSMNETKNNLERTDSKLKQAKAEWAAMKSQAENEKRAKDELSLELNHADADIIEMKEELDAALEDAQNLRQQAQTSANTHSKELVEMKSQLEVEKQATADLEHKLKAQTGAITLTHLKELDDLKSQLKAEQQQKSTLEDDRRKQTELNGASIIEQLKKDFQREKDEIRAQAESAHNSAIESIKKNMQEEIEALRAQSKPDNIQIADQLQENGHVETNSPKVQEDNGDIEYIEQLRDALAYIELKLEAAERMNRAYETELHDLAKAGWTSTKSKLLANKSKLAQAEQELSLHQKDLEVVRRERKNLPNDTRKSIVQSQDVLVRFMEQQVNNVKTKIRNINARTERYKADITGQSAAYKAMRKRILSAARTEEDE